MVGFGKPQTLIGLDIGSSMLKAVELRRVGKGFRVAALAVEAVPADSIVDGSIVDGPAVVGAIRRLFQNGGFTTTEVASSLSGNAVIVKMVSLPTMTDAELAASIFWEAEQYIPFDIKDVNLDYRILPGGPASDARDTMDVLLVAAKKERIAEQTALIEQAGRFPAVLDVDGFALQNAYEANYDLDPGAVIVLLNAGASAININILSGGRSLFTRDISIGGNTYTEAVQNELSVPLASAELAKRGQVVEGIDYDDVRPVLQAVTETVLRELEKTFDFYKESARSDRIDLILLSGGGAIVEGFADSVAERFGVPVEPFDAFKKVICDPQKLRIENLPRLLPTVAVAVGLALRTAGDR